MAYRQQMAALRLVTGLVLLITAGFRPPAFGNPSPAREYEIKAAFLYNFTKFVSWGGPATRGADDPFVIAVLGENPFGDALTVLEKRSIDGRPIVVQRVRSLESLKSCQLLFIASSEEPGLPAILRAAHSRNILTVGDMERFASRGGIIELVLQGDRIAFEINVESAKQAGLTISSKLLSLARAIHREGVR